MTSDAPRFNSNHGTLPALPPHAAYSPVPTSDAGDYIYAPNAEQSKLAEYAATIWYRKYTIVSLVILGASVGLISGICSKPKYEARAVIEIRAQNDRFLNRERFDPTATNGASGADTYLKTQLHLLESDWLLRRVVSRLRKEELNREKLNASLAINDNDPQEAEEAALQAIRNNLSVEPIEQTNLIEVNVTTGDPKIASDLANTIVNEFIIEDADAHRNSMERTGQWLAEQVVTLKNRLEVSEKRLHAYARSADLLFNAREENIQESKFTQIQTELTAAQAQRITKQAQFELLSTARPDTLPEVLNDTTLKEYHNRLLALRQQLAELSSTLAPTHYKVKRTQAQIDELGRERVAYRDDVLRRMRNEYDAAVRREDLLAKSYREQTGTLSDQSSKAVRYHVLKREVDTNRNLYESTLQKVKEAEVFAAMQNTNIRVRDPAFPPSHPVSTKTVNLVAGSTGGLLFGLLMVFWNERPAKGFKNSQEAAEFLETAELGAIPAQPTGRQSWLRKHSTQTAALSLKRPGFPEHGVFAEAQFSPELEPYRMVLTSILCAGWNTRPGTSIVVTSPGIEEGKTMTAANLAVAAAKKGRRTLVIGADLRRPRLHSLFGAENTRGLKDLLLGKALIDDVIQPTSVPNLFLLPSGAVTPDTLEVLDLLDSPRMREVLDELQKRFDTILIDTPPMLHIADARILGRMSQGVVLLLRAGKTSRATARAARQRLMQDAIETVGIVLNDWKPSRSADFGYQQQCKYYAVNSGRTNF